MQNKPEAPAVATRPCPPSQDEADRLGSWSCLGLVESGYSNRWYLRPVKEGHTCRSNATQSPPPPYPPDAELNRLGFSGDSWRALGFA